jgi:hypothetical protein
MQQMHAGLSHDDAPHPITSASHTPRIRSTQHLQQPSTTNTKQQARQSNTQH